MNIEVWPELSFDAGKETYETIHMWTQIMGKIKLNRMPWINHSWHVTLKVDCCGLSTGELAFNGKYFQITLNFLKHQLQIVTNRNNESMIDLRTLSVADFYQVVLDTLKKFDIDITIYPIPNELANAIPFYADHRKTYLPGIAEAFHHALLNVNEVFNEFRAEFVGKCSPVHFFWGSFDLAVSRFSGRRAPLHPGGIPHLPDWVAREAYSHEVCSCGFWTGNDSLPYASFYSYIYPEPKDYHVAEVKPKMAGYNYDFKEFILPYSAVRESAYPSQVLLEFLHSTYNVAADLSGWDRQNLEKKLAEFNHGLKSRG